MGSVTVRLGCEGSPKTHGAVVSLGRSYGAEGGVLGA